MAEVVHALKALRSEAMLAFFEGLILSDDQNRRRLPPPEPPARPPNGVYGKSRRGASGIVSSGYCAFQREVA
jgi:hypothetical protein